MTVEEDEDADDMFSFDNDGRESNRSTFTKIGVQVDKQTGQFIGIESFYAMVEGQNQNSSSRSQNQAASMSRESAQAAVNDLT